MNRIYKFFALKEDLDTLKEQVDGLRGNYNSLDHIVELINEMHLEQLAQGAQMRRIDERLTNIEADIAELKSDMVIVKNRLRRVESDMSVVKTRLGILESDMVEVKRDVSQLKTDVSELMTGVSQLKTNVGILTTDMSLVKKKLEIPEGA